VILVIGAGAVGTFLGATLEAGGEQVHLVRRGAQPDSPAGGQEPPEIILVAVKMPDLPGAIEAAARWPDATLVAVENGVGADQLLLATRPAGGLIAASLTTSVERGPDGSSRRLSRGGIVLAPVRGEVQPTIERLVRAFSAGGLRARSTPNAAAMRWSKLLINLMGNASGAIVDLDPVAVYRDPGLFRLERRQIREALAVMKGLGLRPIRLFGADARLLPIAMRLPAALVQPILVRVVAAGRGGKRPSLHLHLEAGSGAPSEVEWLNGAVAQAAQELGRSAPVNARLAELVDACNGDPERRAWFRGRPERLLAAFAGV
jgi:2-dehydropantoate 2-reductase